MLNLSMNQMWVLGCIAVITGAPFFFRHWVKIVGTGNHARIDKMVSSLTTLIFFALFAGAFVFSKADRTTGEVLLVASIISFSFLYQSRWKAIQGALHTRVIPDPKRSFRASGAKLAFVVLAIGFFAACRYSPVLIALLLFTPFIMPAFIRLQFNSKKMDNTGFKEALLSVFAKANVPIEEIYLLDTGEISQANALVAGSRFGRGIFGRNLFLNLRLFETLDAPELHAVLLHEASHFKHNHITKRLAYGAVFFALSIFWIAMPVAFIFPTEPLAIVAGCMLALVAQFFFLGRVVYRQELEADLSAVHEGCSADALVSALKKISGHSYDQETSWITRLVFGVFHPSGAEREKNLHFGEIPSSLNAIPHKPFCFAYSLFVVGLVFWSAQNLTPSSRMPASANAAKISHSDER